jgi:membrane protease YdiL (CAAX protease family)
LSNVRRIQERHRTKAKVAAPDRWRDDYWTLSRLPLHALVFLIPLIVLYEMGSIAFLRDPAANVTTQIRAESLLNLFFQHFGVIGLMVPGITIAVVLMTMHIIRQDRWTVRPMVVTGMFLESAMWVLPLIVLAAVVTDAAARMSGAGHGAAIAAAFQSAGGGGGGDSLRGMPWQARATIAVGAGVYEELLFRLILIAMVDGFLKAFVTSKSTRAVVCVLVTSLCFAVYHDAAFTYDPATGQGFFSMIDTLLHQGPGAALDRVRWGNALFYTAAGVYFACIYLSRGFGVVVGTHAAYDLAVLVLLSGKG